MVLAKVPHVASRACEYRINALRVARSHSIRLGAEPSAVDRPAGVAFFVETVGKKDCARHQQRKTQGNRVRQEAGSIVKHDVREDAEMLQENRRYNTQRLRRR
jgi:hypothetical protein